MSMMVFKNIAFVTGNLAQSYTIPENVASMVVKAVGGSVDWRAAAGTGGDKYTLKEDMPEAINGRQLTGETLYFVSTNGGSLQIRMVVGLGC